MSCFGGVPGILTVGHAIGEEGPGAALREEGTKNVWIYRKQISHLINRCVFFKIYFLKIIFVDVGSRDGTCFWEFVAVFEIRHRSCLAPFSVFTSLDWLLPGFFSGF